MAVSNSLSPHVNVVSGVQTRPVVWSAHCPSRCSLDGQLTQSRDSELGGNGGAAGRAGLAAAVPVVEAREEAEDGRVEVHPAVHELLVDGAPEAPNRPQHRIPRTNQPPGQHGHQLEHSTRRVWGGVELRIAEKCARNGPK